MEQGKALRPRSDTVVFFETLAGCAVAALVMLGVGGTFYHFVSPGGWLAQLFGRHAAGGLVALVALLSAGAMLWLLRDRMPAETRGRFSELFVYIVAAAGGLYILQLTLRAGT